MPNPLRRAWDYLTGRPTKARALATSLPPGPYAGSWGGGWMGTGLRPLEGLLPGARKDWLRDAGPLHLNSVISSCIGWLQDNFVGANFTVVSPSKAVGDPDDPVESHPALALVGAAGIPNPHYGADELWAATLLDYKAVGNALWIKARGAGGAGDPLQLWWEPWCNVTPRREEGSPNLIDWYDVWRPEGKYSLDPSHVVHFRDGIDPDNPMLGRSRLKAVLREIVGTNDAATYTASLVGQMGGIGFVWMPKDDMTGDTIDDDQAEGLQKKLQRARGEGSGRPVVLNMVGQIERVALSPAEMGLDTLPDRAEASICAALGVQAGSIGIKVSDATRSYANAEQYDLMSWKNGLIPVQDRMGRQLDRQLLPDFLGQPSGLCVRWDRSGVTALMQLAAEAAQNASTVYQARLCNLNEGRKLIGLPAIPGGDATWFEFTSEMQKVSEDSPSEADPNAPEPKAEDKAGGEPKDPKPAAKALAGPEAEHRRPFVPLPDEWFDLFAGLDGSDTKAWPEWAVKAWNPDLHPRGPNGRFINKAPASGGILDALTGGPRSGKRKPSRRSARLRRKKRGTRKQRAGLAAQIRAARAANPRGSAGRKALLGKVRELRATRNAAKRTRWQLPKGKGQAGGGMPKPPKPPKPTPAPKAPPAPSRAKVVADTPEGTSLKAVEARASQVLGRKATARDIASVVGAPDDATVRVMMASDRIIGVTVSGPTMRAVRRIFRGDDGRVSVVNDIFEAAETGKGVGRAAFGRQVDHAARLGVSEIRMLAARGGGMNGYITWAKFGVDGPIPALAAARPAALASATRVADLMRSPEGRAWWEAHGASYHGTFDPTPGSTSRRVWDAYLASKGITP